MIGTRANDPQDQPNLAFWQAIYKPRDAYSATEVTGWIAGLFPYLKDAADRHRNYTLDARRGDWTMPDGVGFEWERPSHSRARNSGISFNKFPSGLSSVPVKLSFSNGTSRDLDLVAGFLTVEQSPLDLSVCPVISWSVAQRAPVRPIVLRV